MKLKVKYGLAVLTLFSLAVAEAYAQATSRTIPFSGLQTTLPPDTTQDLRVELWDQATEGTRITSETQTGISVDASGRISFLFGSASGGLNPDHFPSGASRYLDVVDPATETSVLSAGRIALSAVAFALSPGPAGPAGPEGPPGPPGAVSSVSAGDISIIIGGTPAAPSVAVANNGIDNSKVGDGALSAGKIAGTAATLGANAFTGNQGISGEVSATGAIDTGVQYNIGGSRVVSIAGANNLFVGVNAGSSNTTGGGNAFFGTNAGRDNTMGGGNAFLGAFAGGSNTTGSNNAFFGGNAGRSNTTACCNAFFGAFAGLNNTTGFSNAFFGSGAGSSNTTGSDNAFFGPDAGQSNTTGRQNAFFGERAGQSNRSDANSFFGALAGSNNTTGVLNAFFGGAAGTSNTTESRNTFIGAQSNGVAGITNATAIGADARVTQSNSVVLGNNAVNVGIGTSAPVRTLTVIGRARIGSIPLEPSFAPVCFNAPGDLLQCGASSLRLKTDVKPFRSGLEIVRRLRPISFNWKESGLPDIGLGAEDVAQVAPSLVFTNKGQVEGVKYDRLNMLLINAINEQQKQIEQLRGELRQLQQATSRRHRRRGRR